MRRALAAALLLSLAGLAALILPAAGDYPAGRTAPPDPLPGAPPGPPPWAGPTVAGPTVVVLVFDGWTPEMIADAETPALDRMRREGAWTHRLEPAFPTVSLVNGFTLSTGCWPARHGIVHNRFLDPERGLYDHRQDADWIVECEPLHQAAERQGARTAVADWYGAHSARRGWLVTEAAGAAHRRDFADPARIDWTLEKLARPPARRPRLVLTYLWGPDMTAHFEGLGSTAVRSAVESADRQVGRVMEAMARPGSRGETALVVLTDHGMLPVSRLVNLERVLRRRGIRATMLATGTVGFVYLDDPGQRDRARRELEGHPAFEVFGADDPPAWSRLGDGPRVADLIVSAHPPYFIEDRSTWPRALRWLALHGPETAAASRFLRATHGYPPATPGMAAMLYAWGAGVARGVEVASMDMVDVHPTLAALLGIEPGAPVDGRVVTELLRAPKVPVLP